MIVRVRVSKHGFRPEGEDWRTNVCIVDLLTTLMTQQGPVRATAVPGEEYLRLGGRGYVWWVQEWDGNRP
jgi:hypothetical protein